MEPAAKEEEDDKPMPADAAEGGKEIIRVPDWFVKRMQERGLQRPRPLPEGFLEDDPEFRETVLAAKAAANAFFDVVHDILMQVRDKGYAEATLEYVDGAAKLGIVPKA